MVIPHLRTGCSLQGDMIDGSDEGAEYACAQGAFGAGRLGAKRSKVRMAQSFFRRLSLMLFLCR